jgi:hypothetical protein
MSGEAEMNRWIAIGEKERIAWKEKENVTVLC